MTQFEHARLGKTTPEMEKVALDESVTKEAIIHGVANGEIVIPCNSNYQLARPVGIGKGLRTKVNANIGSSPDCADLKLEELKAKISEEAGADTIMDLSTGGDLKEFRRLIRKSFKGPLGTVPIYEAAIETAQKKGGIIFMTPDDIFDTIERHARDGVDFVTVHCGVTLSAFEKLKYEGRVMDVVSRGGAFLLTWMLANNKENPLYEYFDRLLNIAYKYDLTLSLGDGFRPGSIADSTDRTQIHELVTLGELKERANSKGVQVMIEGPGHIPINEVESNVLLEKKLCHNAPFYVLGPVVTDIAPGYDEITSAIGGAIAAAAGADFLCYVTPAEHAGLPILDEVRRGVIATRIAGHAGDIVKGVKGAMEWDLKMSKARKKLDWKKQIELAIDPEFLRKVRKERSPKEPDVCTMCGKYCAIKLVEEALKKHKH
ncbi:MAG: phosphomethylpyrimidine synthase ThiC [bacterium]|nr:phosphomethylpyrimidine synthase ThiC [bacterium]